MATLLAWASASAQPTGGVAHPIPTAQRNALSPGLTVSQDGVLLRGGEPWRGVGVNMADAQHKTGVEAAFATLAQHRIPFARLFGGEFAPAGFKQYLRDQPSYFASYDRLVRLAETNGIGLIPSLFWNPSTVPAVAGERLSQWGDPASKTRQIMRQYVRDFVGRYKAPPAIWGWEFGNEYNLVSDLPQANWWRPTYRPEGSAGKALEVADQLTHEAICAAFQDFAREVRQLDPDRIISSGCSMPRAAAWHLWKDKSWKGDSPEQFEQMLAGVSASPQNVISVHTYDEDVARIPQAMQVARRLKRPLFVGEFGAKGVSDATKKTFLEALALIEREQVPLAALWVYHRSRDRASWNVTATNRRSYQLQAIAACNQHIREELGGRYGQRSR